MIIYYIIQHGTKKPLLWNPMPMRMHNAQHTQQTEKQHKHSFKALFGLTASVFQLHCQPIRPVQQPSLDAQRAGNQLCRSTGSGLRNPGIPYSHRTMCSTPQSSVEQQTISRMAQCGFFMHCRNL